MELQELVSKLKQSNISKSGDKTITRVKPLWKAASKDQREAILSIADVKDVSVRRAYVTGSISAKLVAAISKTLDVNPYYLTGQVDEAGEYSETLLVEMLKDHKYEKLLTEAGLLGGAVKKRGRRKAAPAISAEPVTAPVDTTEPTAVPVEMPVVAESAAAPVEPPVAAVTASDPASTIRIPSMDDVELTEDEAILLLKAAMLKAKAGGAGAERARLLKAMLLS